MGWATSIPDYIINLTGMSPTLRMYATSDSDTTLIINDANGIWHCNDDSDGLNPSVELPNASPGQYDVWVGSYSQGDGAAAVLHLTELTEQVRIVDDQIVVEQSIHFASNSDEILEESSAILDQLAAFLRNHTDEVQGLQIVGHTDLNSSRMANQYLSQRRAAAVVDALRARQVTQHLDSDGRGESEPLCREDTPACHAQNRRVVMTIVAAP